jgi:hypothetical protein
MPMKLHKYQGRLKELPFELKYRYTIYELLLPIKLLMQKEYWGNYV